jgi:hypothetical protein
LNARQRRASWYYKTREARPVLGPAETEIDIDAIFAGMDRIREKSKKPKNVSIQELRDEGRK